MDFINSLTAFTSAFTHGDFRDIVTWLALLSLFTFILSLISLPYIIRRIPSDYFLKLSKEQPKVKGYDIKSVLIILFRNIFGFFLLLAGVAMLFLPGQGLITILVSLILMDFPGKKRVVAYLTGRKSIQKSIDWVRKKAKKKPIKWP